MYISNPTHIKFPKPNKMEYDYEILFLPRLRCIALNKKCS